MLSPLVQVLRDSIWQFVGAALTLIGIYLTIRSEQTRRGRKELTYHVESVYALLATRLEGDLQIQFRGRILPQAFLAVIRVENSGNRSILSRDYDEPLRLVADDKVAILSATITDSHPPELKIPLKYNVDRETLLGSVLLNPGDRFTLQTLIGIRDTAWSEYQYAPDDYLSRSIAASLRIEGRIVGVRSIIRQKSRRSVLVKVLNFVLNPFVVVFIGLLLLIFGTDLSLAWKIGAILLFVFIVIGNWLLFMMRWLGIDRE